MIEFLTLLLGITVGTLPVELAVSGPVAAVELRLDNQVLERREQAPWVFPCDFGEELRPHQLVAVAFDSEGREVDRKTQWVNFSGKNRDAVLALLSNPDGIPRRGRVVWRSALQRKPVAIRVTLDGQPLEVDSQGHFELPMDTLAATHFLEAEVEFSREESITTEAIFGTARREEILAALTLIPVVAPAGLELPPLEEMAGWVKVGENEVPVSSTQTSGGSVILVRDQSVGPALDGLRRQRRERVFAQAGKIFEPGQKAAFILTSHLPNDPAGAFRTASPKDAQIQSGLWSLLFHNAPKINYPSRQRLWLALSLAGIKAASTQEPRAVILVMSRRPRDSSPIEFEQAWRFLRHLRVPLFVWAPDSKTFKYLKTAASERTYYGADGLLELFAEVQDSLARQRMIWLEGEFLPSDVTLTEPAAAAGVQLAY